VWRLAELSQHLQLSLERFRLFLTRSEHDLHGEIGFDFEAVVNPVADSESSFA
jgi:hypothetical protein